MNLQTVSLGLLACSIGLLAAAAPPAGGGKKLGAKATQLAPISSLSSYQSHLLALPGGIPETFRVTLPIAGRERTLELFRTSLRHADAKLLVQTEAGLEEQPLPPHRTYRGTVVGEEGSGVALTLNEGRIWGMVDLGVPETPRYTIQPLDELQPGADPRAHAVYSSAEVLPSGGRCGFDEAGLALPDWLLDGGMAPAEGGIAALQNYTVEISFDADFEFFQKNGSNVINTVNDIENVMNTVEFVYARDVEIGYELATFVVRATSADPYTTNVMTDLLCEFRNKWNTAPENGIRREIAQLYTGKSIQGGTIGLAWLGVMCNQTGNDCGSFGDLAYSSVESRFSTNFNFRVAVSAHELGHNWGAPHCDGNSPCNIMCSAVNACNGITGANLKFGPSEITTITSGRNSVSCDGLSPLPLDPPLNETFPGSVINSLNWTYNDGGVTTTGAFASSPRSLSLNAAGSAAYDFEEIRSNFIKLAALPAAELKYKVRQIGVEAGEKLVVEYWAAVGTNGLGDWVNINTITSDGATQASFAEYVHTIPANGRHDAFRVRFRTETNETNDNWFIDDVYVGAPTVAPPVNDECATSTVITSASTPFTTLGATTSLPTLPSSCNEANGTSLVNDVWFLYIPDCTGNATVSTCGAASFNTRLAVYTGGCPFVGVNPAACNDDGAGCATGTSSLTVAVTSGLPLYIRIGGVSQTGTGTLSVSCAPAQAPCPADRNGDRTVDATDLAQVLGAWGGAGGDIDGNGTTDASDLAVILGAWGACP